MTAHSHYGGNMTALTHRHEGGDTPHDHTHHNGRFPKYGERPTFRVTHSDNFQGVPITPYPITREVR